MQETRPFEIPHEGDELTRTARQKIDDDIDKLQFRIQSLRTKRNTLSPISVLPPEVISKIFIFVRDSPVVSLYHNIRNNQTQWIRVGQVCHHWREIALGCPSLWSVPVFTKPDLAQEMVRRSKMAALTITSTSSTWTPRILEQLENALGQLSRVRSIDFTVKCHFGSLKTILSPLSQPAPLLEEIALVATYHSQDFSLPIGALSDAPSLRIIDFKRLDFTWGSAVFKNRNLTQLRLKDRYAVVRNDTSTISQMIQALDQLPNLHILELTDSIPSHATSSGNEKTLEFRFLKQLELRATVLDSIFFLRHIRYPPSAMVKLHCSSARVEDCITAMSLIGQGLRRIQNDEAGTHQSPAIIRSAQLRSLRLGVVEIIFFSRPNSIRPSGDNSNPITHICFEGAPIIKREYDHLLTNIYNFFDLSSLEALFVEWDFTCDQTHAIQDSLGKLPRLKHIHVSQFLPGLCLAITETPVSLAERSGETGPHYSLHGKKSQCALPPVAVFPALRTLSLDTVDFRKFSRPENIEYLVNMLIARANMDMPIDRLSLEACPGVRTWQKRRLGELVVDFEVDEEGVDVRLLDSNGEQWNEEDYSDEDEENECDYSDDYFDEYSYSGNGFTWLPF